MKKFYNNTKISGAFSKALRVVALLCVLLGVSSSAWADNIYVTGDAFDGWGNWTQMTPIGDNKYTCVIKNSSGYQLSNEEKKESVEDIKLSNSRDSNSDVDVVLTSDTQELPGFKNTEVVINQLGFRVPKQFYDEKE